MADDRHREFAVQPGAHGMNILDNHLVAIGEQRNVIAQMHGDDIANPRNIGDRRVFLNWRETGIDWR